MDAQAGIAKGWLEECLSAHDSCRKRARLYTIFSTDNSNLCNSLNHDDLMPRRLLAFPPSSTEEFRTCGVVKLVELGKTEEELPYVALSHRWGGKESCIAKKSNIESLKSEGVPFAQLPKTFQDAVTVTQNLGYSNLWIDSLCIIQGDKEDWKAEAPRMAVVYGNAVCTLAAVDASDNDGGFSPSNVDDNVRGGLNRRGWVLQERMISPRTLSFSADSMAWECRECDATQEKPAFQTRSNMNNERSLHPKDIFTIFRDFRLPDSGDDDELPLKLWFSTFELEGDPDEYTPFIRAWWQLISMYTECSLSVESDKFLAMHGISSISQIWTRLGNSWGLWRHFLDKDLVWYIDSMSSASRPKRWLGPSWSWVNTVGGKVVNDYYATLPVEPNLMLKPEIGMPVGTSFDQKLPIPAWSGDKQFYGVTLKGDIRAGEVTASVDGKGQKFYKMSLDPTGRWSEAEVHDFRPDVAEDFEVGKTIPVNCLLFHHYDAEYHKLPSNRDIRLVVVPHGGPQNINPILEETPVNEVAEERTMKRVGYLETTYVQMRDYSDIWDDMWLRYVRLI